MSVRIKLSTEGLDKALRAFKGPLPKARVGILGRSSRAGGGPTNAEIGAAHEFGAPSKKLPVRSFLRVPLMDNLDRYLDRSKAFDKDVLAKVVRSGSIVEWLKKVAAVAETVIMDAFATGGFGKWKPSDMRRKTVHQTLVETTQLSKAITSEVK